MYSFISVIRQHCLEERERAGIAGARKTLKEMPPDAQVEPLAPPFVNAFVLVKCLACGAKADDALRAGVQRRHEPRVKVGKKGRLRRFICLKTEVRQEAP